MKIHLVNYAKGQPYETTQKLLNESVRQHTSYEVFIHDYCEDKIKQCEWFKHISDFPGRTIVRKHDDYFCSWKQFIVLDVLRTADEGDLVYYVDSSRHARTGFTENLDKFFNFAAEIGGIFACVTDDVRNKDDDTGTNKQFWDLIGLGHEFETLLTKRHPLTAWYAVLVNERTIKIFEEMCEWIKYRAPDGRSLVEFHHTQEQTIHCAVMLKHGIPAFYAGHCHNAMKDRNLAVSIINGANSDLKNFMQPM